MIQALLDHEASVRLAIFGIVFATMAAWEVAAPRRPQHVARGKRWPSNLAVAALDALLVRVVVPIGAVALAMLAETKGWGLLTMS